MDFDWDEGVESPAWHLFQFNAEEKLCDWSENDFKR